MNQPDFTKIFFDYFGGKPKKVRYELRLPPNLLHDLTFLSSLVHDAHFRRKDIHIHGNGPGSFSNQLPGMSLYRSALAGDSATVRRIRLHRRAQLLDPHIRIT